MPTPRLSITELGSATEQLITAMRDGCLDLTEGVREFKKRWILQELAEHRFNQSKAARAMGMHRNTLIRYIYELHLDQAWIRTQRNKLCREARRTDRRGSVTRPQPRSHWPESRKSVTNSVRKGGRGEKKSPEPSAPFGSSAQRGADVNPCGRLTEDVA